MLSNATLMRLFLGAMFCFATRVWASSQVISGDCLPITLDMNTTRMEAWMSARAYLMVNATRNYATFNPFGKDEGQRCVSLVNDTGVRTDDYRGFDGKRVIVTGVAVRYDDIPVGETDVDQLFFFRYYHGQRVHNACNRQWVFVAHKIEFKE